MKIVAMVILFTVFLVGCGKNRLAEENNSQYLQDIEENQTAEYGDVSQLEGIDSIIEWEEKNVVIPEVEREYEIWFFSDSHIIIPDETDTDEIQAYATERKKVFVNEKGVDSSQILIQFIETANEQKPDMVLFGGDILDFPSEANMAFLKAALEKLTVPYVYAMGNHDWTFPWEYMTLEGIAQYRPLYEDILYSNFIQDGNGVENGKIQALDVSGNSYSSVIELADLIILAVDDSSNQVAVEAAESIEYAYAQNKPIILLQHVPFSTEKLIAKAKNFWESPVTLGMQIHGGIAPNDVSAELYSKVRDDKSNIRVILAGHVHFPYEEKIGNQTVEIIADAAFKGKAVKLHINSAK